MKYYFYDEKGIVNLIYHVEPPEELLSKNYVTSNKVFEQRKGFFINFKVDLKTKELIVEYLPVPPKPEDEIKALKKEVATLKNQVNTILTKLKITL